MLFDFDLEIPLATSKVNPVIKKVRLSRGVISKITVKFPPGCASLVHVTVRDRLHQIVPANSDGSLNYDSESIESIVEYPINDPPYQLRLIGWSPNTFFNHVVRFQFHMIPSGDSNWRVYLNQLFGGINA